MIRCTVCHRPLTVAAATIASRNGPLNFGPDCARRAGLTHREAQRRVSLSARTRPTKADEAQIPLMLEITT